MRAEYREGDWSPAGVSSVGRDRYVRRRIFRRTCKQRTRHTPRCAEAGAGPGPASRESAEKTVLTADYTLESPVTDGFAPVEPPQKITPTEEAELNRPLEGTPHVWPPRGRYEPVDGPTRGPQVEGDMCETVQVESVELVSRFWRRARPAVFEGLPFSAVLWLPEGGHSRPSSGPWAGPAREAVRPGRYASGAGYTV